ncbi:S8 family peptidase [Peptostreptococcus sp. D1]|uniref:S8 family peptidase n=1 Tax=Peptostreptococcus sp. D1 TaxID=72304 RepID=UPI0008F34763|nr:S8 family serine peptidase [Peptostreptococcus sp. D1]SFE91253.1 Subtilase family protein [Peptostreptococcus sp. D1]
MFANNSNIAVIDTGIDYNDAMLKKYIYFNKELQVFDKINTIYDLHDLNGHGTMCTLTILNECRNVNIYPIKVYDESGEGRVTDVIKALEKLINTDIKLINISSSTTNIKYYSEFENICKKLSDEGKIIICSNSNNGKDSVPAMCDSVIGVDGNKKEYSSLIYKIGQKYQLTTDYVNSIIYCINGEYRLFGKNSKLAAYLCGVIAKLLFEKQITEKKILEYCLENYFKNITISKKDFTDYHVKEELINCIESYCYSEHRKNIRLEELEDKLLIGDFTGIYLENLDRFINYVNNYFGITLDIIGIEIENISYVEGLVNIINKHLK